MSTHKTSFMEMVRIFANLLDGSSDWLELFGVHFRKKNDPNKTTDKASYEFKWKSAGEVEVALQEADAKKIFGWIHKASQGKLELNDGQKTFYPNDDEVMFILAEIAPDKRVQIYRKYNEGSLADFKKALIRLMINPTKRMKFLKVWWEKIKPALDVELNPDTLQQLDDYANRMNARAAELRQEKPKSKYAIIRFFQNLYAY